MDGVTHNSLYPEFCLNACTTSPAQLCVRAVCLCVQEGDIPDLGSELEGPVYTPDMRSYSPKKSDTSGLLENEHRLSDIVSAVAMGTV